jgi:hypothetical protein
VRLFSDNTRQQRQDLIAARQHLAEVVADIDDVTDEYLDANTAVIAAEQPLAWWQRLDIDLGLRTRRPDDTDEF